MGFLDIVSDTIEVATLGLVDDPLGAEQTQEAIQQASQIQTEAGREALEQLRADLAPFTQLGTEAAGQLLGAVLQPDAARVSLQDITTDPAFRQLAEDQERQLLAQRAGLGLAGSGGTQDLLQRNLLRLGEGFRQSRQSEELARQQARFNQLFGASQLGQASAAQTGLTGADILSNIGSIQAQVPLAAAQQNAQFTSGLFQALGQAGGAFFGGPAGAQAGGQMGAALGSGGAVPQQPFFGSF